MFAATPSSAKLLQSAFLRGSVRYTDLSSRQLIRLKSETQSSKSDTKSSNNEQLTNRLQQNSISTTKCTHRIWLLLLISPTDNSTVLRKTSTRVQV